MQNTKYEKNKAQKIGIRERYEVESRDGHDVITGFEDRKGPRDQAASLEA